jgi:hypothetical protein
MMQLVGNPASLFFAPGESLFAISQFAIRSSPFAGASEPL